MSGPILCPRCGDAFRFSSISALQVHLITRHTYETLVLLSQTRVRTSRPHSLLPLPAPMEAQAQSLSLEMDLQDRPQPLEGLDLALSSAVVLSRSSLTKSVLMVYLGLNPGLGPGLGLDLESKVVRTLAEVEERVERKVERLKARLHHKETLLQRQRDTEKKLRAERQELDARVVQLSEQVCTAEDLMDQLRTELQEREMELHLKQQELEQIESFLQGMAQKEAEAKVKLQVFIESLLERAERAERHLLLLTSIPHQDLDQDLNRPSLDEVLTRRLQESIGNRRSFSLSDSERLQLQSGWECAPTRTLSLGSADEDAPPNTARFIEGGWGQTWSKPSRPHRSNEEEKDKDEGEEVED